MSWFRCKDPPMTECEKCGVYFRTRTFNQYSQFSELCMTHYSEASHRLDVDRVLVTWARSNPSITALRMKQDQEAGSPARYTYLRVEDFK